MDCAGGVLKLIPGWWYDYEKDALGEETKVYPCLNPDACSVINNTVVQCASHTTGPLCAMCESGYVPDASATDGSQRGAPQTAAVCLATAQNSGSPCVGV